MRHKDLSALGNQGSRCRIGNIRGCWYIQKRMVLLYERLFRRVSRGQWSTGEATHCVAYSENSSLCRQAMRKRCFQSLVTSLQYQMTALLLSAKTQQSWQCNQVPQSNSDKGLLAIYSSEVSTMKAFFCEGLCSKLTHIQTPAENPEGSSKSNHGAVQKVNSLLFPKCDCPGFSSSTDPVPELDLVGALSF